MAVLEGDGHLGVASGRLGFGDDTLAEGLVAHAVSGFEGETGALRRGACGAASSLDDGRVGLSDNALRWAIRAGR